MRTGGPVALQIGPWAAMPDRRAPAERGPFQIPPYDGRLMVYTVPFDLAERDWKQIMRYFDVMKGALVCEAAPAPEGDSDA